MSTKAKTTTESQHDAKLLVTRRIGVCYVAIARLDEDDIKVFMDRDQCIYYCQTNDGYVWDTQPLYGV